MTNQTPTYDELKAAQDFFEKHGHADCDENWETCIRCGKRVDQVPEYGCHTCTPCPAYRAGMKEGELIQQKLNEELQAKYEKALAFIIDIAYPINEVHPMTRQTQAFYLLKDLGELSSIGAIEK